MEEVILVCSIQYEKKKKEQEASFKSISATVAFVIEYHKLLNL